MCSLRDFEIDRQEEELPDETIKNNLRILKGNLKRSKSQYAKILRKRLNPQNFHGVIHLRVRFLVVRWRWLSNYRKKVRVFHGMNKIIHFCEIKIMFKMYILLGTGKIHASASPFSNQINMQ